MDRDARSREVGRRIMSEGYGTSENYIFCDEESVEWQHDDDDEDDEDDMGHIDNMSVGSRQSITLEIPEGFDASDPVAMAQLVARATQKSSRSVSQGRMPNRLPSSRGRARSSSRG